MEFVTLVLSTIASLITILSSRLVPEYVPQHVRDKFFRNVVRGNSYKYAKYWLWAEANPHTKDEYDKYPIQWACAHGNLGIVKLLTEKEVDIECSDSREESPLIFALNNHVFQSTNTVEIVRHLLGKGAKAKRALRYALHARATDECSEEISELLVKAVAKEEGLQPNQIRGKFAVV